MIIRKPSELLYSAVTPKDIYLNRRRFLAAALAAPFIANAGTKLNAVKSPLSTDEKPTPLDAITHYNNYYEFGTDKEQPAKLAVGLKTSPWTVAIDGEVAKPKTLDLDAIMKIAPLEERIYRHRCVERWSIVVPWIGYSLSEVLKQVEPTSKAKYDAFQPLSDAKQMLYPRPAGIRPR